MEFQKIVIIRCDNNLITPSYLKIMFYKIISIFISIKVKDNKYFEKISEKLKNFVEDHEKIILLSSCSSHTKRLSKMLGKKLKTEYTVSHYLRSSHNNDSNEGITLAFINNKASQVDPPAVVVLVTDKFYIDRLPIYIMSFEHKCYTTRYSDRNGDSVFMNLKNGISEFCAGVA